nr:MAG TPA: hypothetical protein [Caudoviricetes sp.]
MYEERGKTLPDGRIEVIVSDPSTGQEVVRYYSPGAEPKVSLGDLVLKDGFLRDELMPPSVAKKDDLTPLATKEELRNATKGLLAHSEVMDGDKIKTSLLPVPNVTAADGSSLLGSDGKIRHDLLPEGAGGSAEGGSVDLQPLENRVAALEGKANILGEDGKVKADLLPDSCKGEHCEAQPLPSDVVRTADIENVVRKSELFDTAHNMILPELIPEAEVAVKWLKGKGRPDKPETTEGAIVGDEAECTRYLSTDGAGTGAWEWEKRGGVWHVVRGDTGWRKLTSGALADGNFLLIRRNGAQIDVQFYNKGNWGIIKFKPWSKATTRGSGNGASFQLYNIQEGFRGCMAVICPLYDDNTLTQIGGINFNTVVSGGQHVMTARFASNIDKENIPGVRPGLFNFPTVDAWPSSLPGESFEAICPTT